MKLIFILHGFQENFLYDSDRQYPVCWIPKLEQPYRYSKYRLAFIERYYEKDEIKKFKPNWRNYILKKL